MTTSTSNPLDIVMTVWNRPKMTDRCIRHLAKVTTTPSRLIVVNDGSDKETETVLNKLKKEGFIDVLIKNKMNMGLEPSKNIGLQSVRSEFFVSTDNDCLAEYPRGGNDWLHKQIDLMNMNPEYGAIACRTQVMIGTGNIFHEHENESIVDFPWPGGSLRIMNADTVKKLGGWRDWRESRGEEERHMGGKMAECGVKMGFSVKIRCYHMFGDDGNWGYGMLDPQKHGHNPVCHPAIQNGDNEENIERWLNHEE